VVHRDIKPANMMLTSGGMVKLMDFGIARSSADHKLTQTGTTVGSLYYMSPEQIQGVTAPDARSDLYSVGVSLYELVTGKRPFDGDSQFAIMSAHLAGTPVPPVTVDPRLPQLLNDVILMSVAKDAGARFQTAGALRNALSNVVPGVKATAPLPAPAKAAPAAAVVPTAGQAAQAAKPVSHRGQWMALGAVAAVLAIVAVVAIAPWKGTGAASGNAAPPVTQPAAVEPPPVAAQPPAQVPAQPEPQAQQPAASVPVTQPANHAAAAKTVSTGGGKAVPAASQSAAPSPSATASQPAPVQQVPVPQQPAQAQQPAETAPSRAELQQTREHLAMLGVRASGVRTSMQSLQRTQSASGMNMRGDIQDAAILMTTYLNGADAALNAGDVTQSRSFADKAERQLEKLEKFFNR
jgi:serine/threonine-protein kinase